MTESEDEKLNEDDSDGKKGRIRAPYKLRRNDKGESPLHIAVISGNYKRVKNLIAHGHPTNERDNCGWLPIHEAANHNHLEIATFLIEHNAWLNDKGLEGCGGMTPILDAASAGNLEMVRLLFDRGADVTCRDNDGKSLIDALSDWRRENLETAGGTSDADAELKFQDLVADLQAAMIEAGVKRTDLRAPVRKRRGSENRKYTWTTVRCYNEAMVGFLCWFLKRGRYSYKITVNIGKAFMSRVPAHFLTVRVLKLQKSFARFLL